MNHSRWSACRWYWYWADSAIDNGQKGAERQGIVIGQRCDRLGCAMDDMVSLGARHGRRGVDFVVGCFFQNAKNGASCCSIFGGNEWLGKNTIRFFILNGTIWWCKNQKRHAQSDRFDPAILFSSLSMTLIRRLHSCQWKRLDQPTDVEQLSNDIGTH